MIIIITDNIDNSYDKIVSIEKKNRFLFGFVTNEEKNVRDGYFIDADFCYQTVDWMEKQDNIVIIERDTGFVFKD